MKIAEEKEDEAGRLDSVTVDLGRQYKATKFVPANVADQRPY